MKSVIGDRLDIYRVTRLPRRWGFPSRRYPRPMGIRQRRSWTSEPWTKDEELHAEVLRTSSRVVDAMTRPTKWRDTPDPIQAGGFGFPRDVSPWVSDD